MALGVRAECRRGCIPSDLATGTAAEIEEERRLLYVAVTRARDELHLLMPQRFFTHGQRAYGDRHVFAARSRFIPEALLGPLRLHHMADSCGANRRRRASERGLACRSMRTHAGGCGTKRGIICLSRLEMPRDGHSGLLHYRCRCPLPSLVRSGATACAQYAASTELRA